MKAWRFHAFGDLRLDDVSEPVCGPGHVVVEPICVQPSVTEAQLAQGIPTLAYDRIKRRLETEPPVQLFGHEFCARIIEVGSDVTRFRVGERVAARAKLPCGECPLCRSERSDLCRAGPVFGFDLPGCFAERARVPEIALVKVDDRISDSEAACLQSLSDSVAAVETAKLQMADTVAILGQGAWVWNACKLRVLVARGRSSPWMYAMKRARCRANLVPTTPSTPEVSMWCQRFAT